MTVPVILIALATVANAAALEYDVPAGWVTRPAASSMRVAEFALPRTGADKEDAELVLYFFGGTGGTVQANLDRWMSQIAQPDGKPSNAVAKTSTVETRTGLKVSLIDLSGTYVAEVKPGSAERHHKPGFRLRAAVVETPEGPYFVKLTGPAATVAKRDESFMAFVRSLRVDAR